MNVLLSLLHSSPEYESLRTMLDAGQTAAVSGVSQIARAHWIAALHEDTGRPVVAVCQDEMAASRLAAELTAFLGQPPVTLPSRELTFLDAAGVSREWEQRRLRILYDLSAGKIPVLVTTLEALQLRTIPKSTLYAASIRLDGGRQLRRGPADRTAHRRRAIPARASSRARDSSRCAAAFSTSCRR